MNSKKFYEEYYSSLKGWTCVDVIIKTEDNYGLEDNWPTLVFTHPEFKNEIHLELSSDEEGNRPGFAFGLPIPEVPATN